MYLEAKGNMALLIVTKEPLLIVAKGRAVILCIINNTRFSIDVYTYGKRFKMKAIFNIKSC